MTDRHDDAEGPSPALAPEWEHRRQPMNEFQERFCRLTVQVMTGLNNVAFRLSEGRVGGHVGGAPVCLLTATGRKTGRPRTVALVFRWCGDEILLAASNAGMSRPPQWYANVLADPVVEISLGDWRQRRIARVVPSEERDAYWPRLVEVYMHFENYQERTDRDIPLLLLSPAGPKVFDDSGL